MNKAIFKLSNPPVCQCGSQTFRYLQYVGTTQDYDGVSEIICVSCGKRYGRWSQRELPPGEIELRYGGK